MPTILECEESQEVMRRIRKTNVARRRKGKSSSKKSLQSSDQPGDGDSDEEDSLASSNPLISMLRAHSSSASASSNQQENQDNNVLRRSLTATGSSQLKAFAQKAGRRKMIKAKVINDMQAIGDLHLRHRERDVYFVWALLFLSV